MPIPVFHTTVPFTVVDNRLLVDASVNGKRLALIVDTGTTGIVLTPQDVAALKLRTTAGPNASGAGPGTPQTRRTELQDVQLGTYHVGRVPAIAISLDRIRKAFHFPRLDGIIGYDMLGGKYVGIDMDTHSLTLSSTPLPVPSSARVVSYRPDSGVLTVDAAIDGVHGPAIVDTGDRSSFTVFEPFARANNFYNLSQRRHNVVTGIGVGGPIHADVFQSTIDALGFTAGNVTTRAPVGPSGAFDSPSWIGSVGEALLRRYNLIFDGAARTITAWPNASDDVARSSESDSQAFVLPRHATFGAAFGAGQHGATIAQVIPGGAAAADGMQPGDVVTALAGIPTATTPAFLAAIHTLHAGDRVRLDFDREGRQRTATVTLGTPANESDPNLSTTYGAIAVDGTLRRTLVTMPKNASGRLPAMLIVGGIGCYSVDVAFNPQDPYLRLAHDIASAGFVTMRVEKSGVGDSEGPPCAHVDFEAERRAYAAGLQALRNDPHVDSSRIYLFGHSIGTLEAPMLANEVPVAGVIVAEAVGRDWPEYEVRNLRRQLELTGASPADVDAALTGKQECLERLLVEKQPEADIERSEPDCKVHNGVYPVDASYMQQVVHVNPIAQWSKIDVAVLAIYGTSDVITEAADHQRIVDAVNARHPGTASFQQIDGMDHFLSVQPSTAAAMNASAKGLPRTYDSALSSAVVQWLCLREKCSLAPG